MVDEGDLLARLDMAVTIAREAGQITLEYFRSSTLRVERKNDDSPVTQADRQAELLLRKRILAAYPNDSVVGEEFGSHAGESKFQWVLDPIDGTKSFIHGVPLYGTMIGLLTGGRSVLGVIHLPALNECVYAAKGLGAWQKLGDAPPIPAQVSEATSLREGSFLTSEVQSFLDRGAENVYRGLAQRAWISRTWGDCYGYCLVATGRALAMVDPILNLWDAAAVLPIMEEAGGAFTDWQGQNRVDGGDGIGANRQVLEEVLSLTRTAPRLA